MGADGEVMEEMRKSHRGMVDGCRWNGGGMGYSRLPDARPGPACQCQAVIIMAA
jgi:hypothetical protein